MDFENILNILKQDFNNRVALKKRKEGVYQLFAPMYHEDGDMIEIFLTLNGDGKIRITDLAMTLMRLTYSYEIDTPNKERIYKLILSQNHINEDNGKLYIDVSEDDLYSGILQLAQVIAKISNMKIYKRELIRSLFMEMLTEFIMTELKDYGPMPDYYPIEGHEEYKVDFCFNHRPRPIYLFGVPDSAHARLATISCLKFQTEKLKFRSVAVLEDLDLLGKKDQARLMSAADKEFPSLDDFQENSKRYLERELAK
jgi:hypothetical protein